MFLIVKTELLWWFICLSIVVNVRLSDPECDCLQWQSDYDHSELMNGFTSSQGPSVIVLVGSGERKEVVPVGRSSTGCGVFSSLSVLASAFLCSLPTVLLAGPHYIPCPYNEPYPGNKRFLISSCSYWAFWSQEWVRKVIGTLLLQFQGLAQSFYFEGSSKKSKISYGRYLGVFLCLYSNAVHAISCHGRICLFGW